MLKIYNHVEHYILCFTMEILMSMNGYFLAVLFNMEDIFDVQL